MHWFWIGLFSLGAALTAGPLVLSVSRDRMLDMPNHRSSHTEPTPRAGGIALIVGVTAGLVAMQPSGDLVIGVIVTAGLLGSLGLAEDVLGLEVGSRLVFQFGAAAVGLFWMLSDMTGSGIWRLIFGLGCLFWIVGYTNAFNFMDGINGISAAQLVVAGLTWLLIGTLEDLSVLQGMGAITAGSALGFLPWNFPKARFFMGDVGSYFSGAWLSAIAILAIRTGVPVPAAIAPLLIYGIDTSLTLAMKKRAGIGWHEPHRAHIYQRLVRAGWSHARTTLFYAMTVGAISIAGLTWLTTDPTLISVASLFAATLAILYTRAPSILDKESTP